MIEPFVEYCRIRLRDDPHVWASTLFDELLELGFSGSYPSLTAAIRKLELRPHCEACAASRGRDAAIITHPPGEETQWDWLELPDPPAHWEVGRHAHLLVGALSCSGKWRGVLAETEDFGHLVAAIEQVVARLGGVTQCWRFDRMATVCDPGSGRVTKAFAGVAKHHGVAVKVCPSRHGNRKGVVEKVNHSAAQRWWRTVPDDITITAAQAGIDRLATRMDNRTRVRDGQRLTVGELADHEHLRPAPDRRYPVDVVVTRTVTPQGLVSFDGNQYSVPPGLPGAEVEVRTRLGEPTIRVVTAGGATVAAHQRQPAGAGAVVRDEGHVIALERAVLAAFSQARPCIRKARRPLSAAATAEATRLHSDAASASERAAERVVIDLAAYAALVPPAAARSTIPIPKEIP